MSRRRPPTTSVIPGTTFTLASNVNVGIEARAVPPGHVYWTLSHVCLGFTPADPEYEDVKYPGTVGSDLLWGDEYRFGRDDGRLRSFYLTVPTSTMRWGRADAYIKLPLDHAGSLVLSKRGDCGGPISTVAAFDPLGSALVALYPTARSSAPNRRFNIADGLDLLCDGSACSGWILHRPAEVLVEGGRERHHGKERMSVDPEVLGFIDRFLGLLQEPVYDGDRRPNGELRRDLEQLHAAVRGSPESRATAVLLTHIRRCIGE